MIPAFRKRQPRPLPDAFLERVLEDDEDGILITGKDGIVVYANPAYARMARRVDGGMTPSVDRLFDDRDSAAQIFRLARAARSGSRAAEMLRHSGPDGGWAWYRVAVRPLEAGFTVWRLHDATLETGNGHYSESTQRVIGPNGSSVPADGASGSESAALSANAAPDLGSVSTAMPETALTLPGTEEDGRRLGLQIGGLSASDQESELQRAGARFTRFFENAPVGIVIVAADGTIDAANAAFGAMVDPLPNRGARLLEAVAEEDREEVATRIRDAVEGRPARPVIEVRLAGAGERVAQLYASRIEEEPSASVVLYLIDMTEQKNLELQFAQSQKMQAVGQLAGGIAHDFNNLLTAILGFCDLLLVRHRPGDPSFGDVMQIKQNANRAANLVRQLLAFSRKQTLRPKVLVLTDELSELSNLLRRLLGEKIELKVLHGRNLGPVRVDQGQLEQVIINLAVNARDAMPDGGTLTIRTANISAAESRNLGHPLMPVAEYVLIEVSDTGVGIAKENLGKIFEPFFTTKEVGKGTGLGLSTVYGIVKQTGGFIFPVSEPGKGATFRIYLPRHDATESIPTAPEIEERESPSDLTGKGTILLVEDEDAVRAFAVRALSNRGYTVIEAADGAKALDIVREHTGPIDLVISDVVMPNMDGPALLREIRNVRPEVRIVFISGYAEEAFRKSLERDESFTFLPKPFSLKQLASTVKEVLNQD